MLLFSNYELEFVVTSGVIISVARLSGNPVEILNEVWLLIVKVSSLSSTLQENSESDRNVIRIIDFVFIVIFKCFDLIRALIIYENKTVLVFNYCFNDLKIKCKPTFEK